MLKYMYMEASPAALAPIDRHRQWYDTEFEHARLTEEDAPWLEQLRGSPVDEVWIQEANDVIAVGSIDLRSNTDPETAGTVAAARSRFYEDLLGWGNPDHALHQAYAEFVDADHLRAMPLVTVIGTQRVLSAHGISSAKVVAGSASILHYAPETIEETISHLGKEGLGLNATKIINTLPSILGMSIRSIDASISNLEELGINAVKCINGSPPILVRSPRTIRERVAYMDELGFDTHKIIRQLPNVLGYSKDALDQKIAYLRSLGLDPIKVLNTSPTTLSMSTETMQKKADNLAGLGLEPATIIRKFPKILTYDQDAIKDKFNHLLGLGIEAQVAVSKFPMLLGLSSETVTIKFNNLKELGLDPGNIVRNSPQTLGLAIESVKAKMELIDSYIVKLDWQGGTAADLVNIFPALLGLSEKKIRFHARFFAAYGRQSMSAKEVTQLIMMPVERHVIWTGEKGGSRTVYSNTNVNAVTKAIEAKERRSRATELLEDPALKAALGRRIIEAYDAYIKKDK
jgi:hypothetical protein